MSHFTSSFYRSTIALCALLAATAGWAALWPAQAGAVTFTVNRNDDITPRATSSTCNTAASTDCTLREAVIKANATAACAPPNAACTINFTAGTNGTPIQLTIPSASNAADPSSGDLDINANVQIVGNGPTNTIIQGNFPVADNQDNKIFGINQDGTFDDLQVTIDNVTVTGGRNSVHFNDPSFAWTGGGIDIFLTGTTAKTVLSNCVITNNANVHGYGGGINISSLGSGGVQNGQPHGSVEITNCEISNNHELGTPNTAGGTDFGTCGGGICTGFSDNHNVTITDSRIGGNSTPGSGGGIGIIMNHGTVAIHNSTIGGSLPLTTGCTNCGNTAGQQGGGINADGIGAQSVVVDQKSVIQNNVAGTSTAASAVGSGGGIQSANSANSSTSLSKVTIVGNSVSTHAVTQNGGGGIFAGGNLTVSLSRIVGNSAGGGVGSGLRVDNGGPGTVVATSNWWGCNSGPSAAPCDTAILSGSGAGSPPATLSFNPWLVLSLNANPTSVTPSGTSALTADFLHRNDNTGVTTTDIAVLLGLPIAFGSTHGSISGADAKIQSTGTATATFTHDATCLDGTATATVDTTPGPTVSTPITVTCPDLTAMKSNNVSGSVPLSNASWTWTIHVANVGSAAATFATGQTILTDNLPTTNISYGAAGVSNPTGITGSIICTIATGPPFAAIAAGTLNCTANGSVTIAAPGSFDVSFTATATAAGAYANPRAGGICRVDPNSAIPEGNEGNNDCSNSVTVVAPPAISKAFSPTSIAVGGTSTLTITINNPNGSTALAGVAFSDTLPASVQVAAVPNSSNTCNGTLTGATAGSGAISLSGGSIAAGSSCAVSVDVTATSGGGKNNTTGAVSSTNGGTGQASNTATLTVTSPPTVSKAFSPTSIGVGGTSTLTLTISNPNGGTALTGVAVSDTFPSGVKVASTPNSSNTCNGTLSGATAGSGAISLTGGTVDAGGSCAISVDVTATSAGGKDNTTGAVSSTNGGTGTTSNTATLTVSQNQLTAIGPATVWIGLKNSDDAGLRVDLRADVFVKNGAAETLVGGGQLDNQSAGSSGFNNALLYTIPLSLTAGPVDVPTGAQLEVRVSARRTCASLAGHFTGTVRLWFNGQNIDGGPTRDAGTRVTLTKNGAGAEYFLKTGFVLNLGAGLPRTSLDQFVNSAVSCGAPAGRPFTSFGTWITP